MIEIALLIQWGIFILTVAMVFKSANMTQYHPITVYIAFHGIVFVFRPTISYFYNLMLVYNYMKFTPNVWDEIVAFLATSMALLVFVVTCAKSGRTDITFCRASELMISDGQKRAGFATAIICLPIGLYSAWTARLGFSMNAKDSGISLVRAANGYALHVDSTGYLTDAQFMIAPVLILLIVILGSKLRIYIPFILFLAWRAIQGSSRWTIVLNVAILALITGWRAQLKWPRLFVVMLVIPFAMLFHALGENRHLFRSSVFGENSETRTRSRFEPEKDWYSALDALDLANFEYLVYVMACVPDRSGTYTYGTQYLQIFTEPIPRILWSGKPAGPPIELIELNKYGNFIGLTVSIVGDGWMSGGWIGLVITMSIVGFICGFMHKQFWKKNSNIYYVLIYISFLPMTIQWFRDGGISIVKFLFFTWFPIFIWILLCKFFMRYNPRE